jgi:hypothetical protein
MIDKYEERVKRDENEEKNRPQPRTDGLNEYHPYKCAYCGEENDVFADATATWLFEEAGTQRQFMTEECVSCYRRNMVTLSVNREGVITVEVQPLPEL